MRLWECSEPQPNQRRSAVPPITRSSSSLDRNVASLGQQVPAPDVAAAGQHVRESPSPTCTGPPRRRGRRPPRTAARPGTGYRSRHQWWKPESLTCTCGWRREVEQRAEHRLVEPPAGHRAVEVVDHHPERRKPVEDRRAAAPRSVPAWSTQAIVPGLRHRLPERQGLVGAEPGSATGPLALAERPQADAGHALGPPAPQGGRRLRARGGRSRTPRGTGRESAGAHDAM